jgi:hypothetical protein
VIGEAGAEVGVSFADLPGSLGEATAPDVEMGLALAEEIDPVLLGRGRASVSSPVDGGGKQAFEVAGELNDHVLPRRRAQVVVWIGHAVNRLAQPGVQGFTRGSTFGVSVLPTGPPLVIVSATT